MTNYVSYFLGPQVLGWLAAVLVIAGGLTWLLRRRLGRPGRQALFFLFLMSLGLVVVVTLLREPWLGACPDCLAEWGLAKVLAGRVSTEVWLNVVLFVPLALFATLLWRAPWRTAGAALLLSLVIEVVQPLVGVGANDLMDLVANTSGALIGAGAGAVVLLIADALRRRDVGPGRVARVVLSIGLGLGADVPFFIGGHNAWVEGVGERLTPVSLPPARFAIVKPATGASTQAIFSAPMLRRDTKTAILQGFAANAKSGRQENEGRISCDLQKILAFGHNDLQPVAQTLCPDVVRCIDWLSARGLQGRMTGSGTAVFAQLPQAVDLSGAPDGWMVRECGNMDAHPLLDWCTG